MLLEIIILTGLFTCCVGIFSVLRYANMDIRNDVKSKAKALRQIIMVDGIVYVIYFYMLKTLYPMSAEETKTTSILSGIIFITLATLFTHTFGAERTYRYERTTEISGDHVFVDIETIITTLTNRLGRDRIEFIRKDVEDSIIATQRKQNFRRYTDLFIALFSDTYDFFTDMNFLGFGIQLCAYYQILFTNILTVMGVLDTFLVVYTTSTFSGVINNDLHSFMKMLIQIQIYIGNAIMECAKSGNDDYHTVKVLNKALLRELNNYVDDASDWNKIY